MSETEARVEGARRFQKHLFDNAGFHLKLNEAFDHMGFSQAYVDARVGTARPVGKQKALKDSVWGMMEFDAPAMRLIDSPLLQRLRRIKQLGFTYLTYPSAEHSRFPHSVGMAHVVTKFISAINRRRDGGQMQKGLDGFKGMRDLDPLSDHDLVHAGLLHDIGHLPFSHAAESAIEASRDRFVFGGLDYEEFKDRAGFFFKGELSLSEALSIAIVLSPRFGHFYGKYVRPDAEPDSLLRIACLIAGQRAHDHCGNIQGIISSSSVDADKIDYVNRDAAACGIPIGVDVSRVFLGSSLIGVQASKAAELGFGADDRLVFALNASGWDTYDEIIRARSMLYQRVYLHSFTRTAEALFARSLKLDASELNTGFKDAVDIWRTSDTAIIDTLALSPNAEVAELAVSLRDRNMPKKACALGTNMLGSLVPARALFPDIFDGPENVGALSTLKKQIADPFRRKFTRKSEEAIDSVAFEDEVRAEAQTIADRLRSIDDTLVPTEALKNVVLIEIAGLDQKKSEAPVFQYGELLSSELFTNVRGVSDASDHFRQIGYVMAPGAWREIVCLAARSVLYRDSFSNRRSIFAVSPSDPAVSKKAARGKRERSIDLLPLTVLDLDALYRRTGLDRKKTQRILDALQETDYFDEMPALASKTGESALVDAFHGCEKFAGEGGWSINRETLASFVDQFPPRLRRPLIDLLKQGDFVDREAVDERLAPVIQTILADHPNAVFVPLSASSGGAVQAALRQSFKSHPTARFEVTVKKALGALKDDGIIVFVDDNAASGTQAAAQLYAFSGLPRTEWPDPFQAETALTDDLTPAESESLKAAKFMIAVAVGHTKAAERLAEVAETLDFREYLGLRYQVEIGDSLEWPADLKSYLADVGRELYAQDRWQLPFDDLTVEQKLIAEENAFGYGNIGGLTFFQTSVPTSTATAFWLPGKVRDRPWTPLGLRWGRLKNFVLA